MLNNGQFLELLPLFSEAFFLHDRRAGGPLP
jgi:hypothetical protein